MKTAVVTFHRAYNYGAVLQSYGLVTTLRGLGVDTEILDYHPEAFEKMYLMKADFQPNKYWLKTFLASIKLHGTLLNRKRKFENFIDIYIPHSKKQYRNIEELNNSDIDYDAYVVGSDQVWNFGCTDHDPVFFLRFKDALAKKKYSYAASFGFAEAPAKDKEDYIEYLKGFEAYSVREDNGRKILADLGYNESLVCCDPTILLTMEQWEKLVKEDIETEPYIFLYYVERSTDMLEKAKRLSSEKKMKVILLTCNMEYYIISGDCDRKYGFEHIVDASPEGFVSLIAGAEYVLTTSFHGTVFSVLFHKKFLVQSLFDDGHKNGRSLFFLKQMGLGDRLLENGLDKIDESIDWSAVEDKLHQFRQNSLNYLLDIKKELPPYLVVDKEDCCGCEMCVSICPIGAITLYEDEQGFRYPVIDRDKCVNCRKCLNSCRFKKDLEGNKNV